MSVLQLHSISGSLQRPPRIHPIPPLASRPRLAAPPITLTILGPRSSVLFLTVLIFTVLIFTVRILTVLISTVLILTVLSIQLKSFTYSATLTSPRPLL